MPIQGFTVYQAAPGAILSFVPAMGTAELDQLIDAYISEPITTQEKRAMVSMEFFTHNALTEQTHLFFPVDCAASGSPATNSPGSSFADSGYGSVFNPSPLSRNDMSTPAASTPATPAVAASSHVARQNRVLKQKSKAAKKPAASRASTHDFSGMPGMQILTMDGVDVTNTARGSKSKQDREHAHLIRMLKSCPECKRKKTRCDPSHKRDLPSQQQPQQQQQQLPQQQAVASSPPTSLPSLETEESGTIASTQPCFLADNPSQLFMLENFTNTLDLDFSLGNDIFNDFINEEPFAPVNDYFLDSRALMFTPDTLSYASPAQFSFGEFSAASQPFAHHSGIQIPSMAGRVERVASQPEPPYLHPDGHGSDYVDFTLFSPAPSSSVLDEDPREIRSEQPLSRKDGRPQSASSSPRHVMNWLDVTRSAHVPTAAQRESPILSPLVSLGTASSPDMASAYSKATNARLKDGDASPVRNGHTGSSFPNLLDIVNQNSRQSPLAPRFHTDHPSLSSQELQTFPATIARDVDKQSINGVLQQPASVNHYHVQFPWYRDDGIPGNDRSALEGSPREQLASRLEAPPFFSYLAHPGGPVPSPFLWRYNVPGCGETMLAQHSSALGTRVSAIEAQHVRTWNGLRPRRSSERLGLTKPRAGTRQRHGPQPHGVQSPACSSCTSSRQDAHSVERHSLQMHVAGFSTRTVHERHRQKLTTDHQSHSTKIEGHTAIGRQLSGRIFIATKLKVPVVSPAELLSSAVPGGTSRLGLFIGLVIGLVFTLSAMAPKTEYGILGQFLALCKVAVLAAPLAMQGLCATRQEKTSSSMVHGARERNRRYLSTFARGSWLRTPLLSECRG